MASGTRRPALTRALRPVGACLLAAGLLSGCGAHPGVAAVLTYTDGAGQRVSVTVDEQDVSDAVTDLSVLQIDRRSAIIAMLNRPRLEEALKGVGVEVSDAEVETFTKNTFDTVGKEVPSLSAGAREVMRAAALDSKQTELDLELAQKVGEEMAAAAQSAQIEASPRYREKLWIANPAQLPAQQVPSQGR